jgi:hypothetical protein
MFAVAERLGCSVVNVEAMSHREIMGWIDYATPARERGQDMGKMSRDELRKAFGG